MFSMLKNNRASVKPTSPEFHYVYNLIMINHEHVDMNSNSLYIHCICNVNRDHVTHKTTQPISLH